VTIISPNFNFIFVHIRKCGGTSFEKSFEEHAVWNDLIIGSTNFGESIQPFFESQFGLHKHNTALELREIIGADSFSKYNKIAFVRHPRTLYESYFKWGRSVLQYKSKGNKSIIDAWRNSVKKEHFEHDFLSWGAIRASLLSASFEEFLHLALANNWLQTDYYKLLGDKKGKIIIDHIFKIEEVAEKWGKLEKVIGTKLKRYHSNRSLNFKTSWTREMVELVNNKHELDYSLLNYPKIKII
tara:strand:- start:442 stop:1164 length:723 start_codon:yes stop_codon:yes gene_type:complete